MNKNDSNIVSVELNEEVKMKKTTHIKADAYTFCTCPSHHRSYLYGLVCH